MVLYESKSCSLFCLTHRGIHLSGLKKPISSFNKLFEVLLPIAELVAPINQGEPTSGIFVRNEKDFAKIYLLTKGYAHVKRSVDNITMFTMFSPFSLGFSLCPGVDSYYTIELGPESELYQISRVKLLNTVKRDNLFREWMNVVSYKLAFLYERDRNVLNQNSEYIVSRMLMRLMELPSQFRDNISLVKFVEERTCLSRSCIQRIVNKLRNDGYILTEGSRLIKVNFANDMHVLISR